MRFKERPPHCGKAGAGRPEPVGRPGLTSAVLKPETAIPHLIASAHAAVAALLAASSSSTPKTNSNALVSLLPLVLIFGVAYVFFLRPRAQAARRQRDTLMEISVGDEVLTGAGIFGRVLDVESDRVTLETAPGTRITVLRSTIARRLSDSVEDQPNWDEHDEDEAHGAYHEYEHDHDDADPHDANHEDADSHAGLTEHGEDHTDDGEAAADGDEADGHTTADHGPAVAAEDGAEHGAAPEHGVADENRAGDEHGETTKPDASEEDRKA